MLVGNNYPTTGHARSDYGLAAILSDSGQRNSKIILTLAVGIGTFIADPSHVFLLPHVLRMARTRQNFQHCSIRSYALPHKTTQDCSERSHFGR